MEFAVLRQFSRAFRILLHWHKERCKMPHSMGLIDSGRGQGRRRKARPRPEPSLADLPPGLANLANLANAANATNVVNAENAVNEANAGNATAIEHPPITSSNVYYVYTLSLIHI